MTLDNTTTKTSKLWLTEQRLFRGGFLHLITNLRLAIILLLLIALFSVTGTIIEQGKPPSFYQANYPESPALLGFLSWKVIQLLGLNDVYRTWWFLVLIIFFGISLSACTLTRQLPMLKTAQRWKFYDKPQQFAKLALSAEFNLDQNNYASLEKLSKLLNDCHYKVFREQQGLLYARKGIIGRIGPIVVHIGIIAILLGSIWGALTGFVAQEMIPSGSTFKIKNIITAGPFAVKPIALDWSVRVNRFWIEYTANGRIDQFYSDMSVLNALGEEVDHKKIFVNQPLRYQGITFYQTSWNIAGVKVQINNSPIFQLPMAELDNRGKGKLWGTWIPTKSNLSSGVSLVTNNLQGTVSIYNSQGKLITILRTGMSTEINGATLKLLDIVGSTGLQIKSDPGIIGVYTGFAILIFGVVLSYFSHSQIWALQKDSRLYVGGKTNRAQIAFEKEILYLFDQLDSSQKK